MTNKYVIVMHDGFKPATVWLVEADNMTTALDIADAQAAAETCEYDSREIYWISKELPANMEPTG